jgi:hypothetical protein
VELERALKGLTNWLDKEMDRQAGKPVDVPAEPDNTGSPEYVEKTGEQGGRSGPRRNSIGTRPESKLPEYLGNHNSNGTRTAGIVRPFLQLAVPPVTGILGKTPSDVLYSEGVFKGSEEEALYPVPERRRGPNYYYDIS